MATLKAFGYTAYAPRHATALGDHAWISQIRVSGLFPSKSAFIRAMLTAEILSGRNEASVISQLRNAIEEPTPAPTWQDGVLYVAKLNSSTGEEVPLSTLTII